MTQFLVLIIVLIIADGLIIFHPKYKHLIHELPFLVISWGTLIVIILGWFNILK